MKLSNSPKSPWFTATLFLILALTVGPVLWFIGKIVSVVLTILLLGVIVGVIGMVFYRAYKWKI